MKLATCSFALVLLAGACGCRSNTAPFDALYSELRMWEDEVACLEDELDEADARLESARRENATLRRQLAGRDTTGGGEPVGPPDTTTEPPQIEMPEGEPYVPPTSPPGELPAPGGEAPPYVPPGAAAPLRAPGARVRRTPQVNYVPRPRQEAPIHDWVVSEITLNRQLTGGHDRDQRPGDDGLMVVIEPRNKAGQILEVPGAVSVVVHDAAVPGPEGRVARWDFGAPEVADHFRQTVIGKGIHIDLPWPAAPPVGRELNLYVRYTTDDGRKLFVERRIQVDPLPSVNVAAHPNPHPAPRSATRGAQVRARIAGQTIEREGPPEGFGDEFESGPMLAEPEPDAAPSLEPIEDDARTARRHAPPRGDEDHLDAPALEDTADALDVEDAREPAAPPKRRRPTWSPDR